MQFAVRVEWQQEDGTAATAELGRIDSDALQSAADLDLKLSDTKPILAQLQNIVTRSARALPSASRIVGRTAILSGRRHTREILPATGGLSAMTTRNRTLVV
jgi:hypothetical protein